MSRHGKQVLTQSEADKTKWEVSLLDALVDICVEILQSITRTPGSPVPKFEWEGITKKFKIRTGLAFTKQALKNRWDQLRKEWTLWSRMTRNETGLGWDSVNRRAVMSDDWWELKIHKNKEYAKFKKNGFRYRDQLHFCFTGGVATGKHCVIPSSGHNPLLFPTEDTLPETNWSGDDVYRPQPVGIEEILEIDPDPVRSTAPSPSKDDFSTPNSRRGFTAPSSANISSPLMPSISKKQATVSSNKRKAAAQITGENPLLTRIATALEAHIEYNVSKQKSKNESGYASSAGSAAAAPTAVPAPTEMRDQGVAILNDMMEGGELSPDQYYYALGEIMNQISGESLWTCCLLFAVALSSRSMRVQDFRMFGLLYLNNLLLQLNCSGFFLIRFECLRL